MARLEKSSTGREEGRVEVGEGALEIEELEVGGVGANLRFEVGGDWSAEERSARLERCQRGPSSPLSTVSQALINSFISG